MKFKEEVFSKIFTYITVLILLGIVIFEAWSLQSERSSLKESRQEAASIQQNLEEMTERNASLQAENEELLLFQSTWLPYAAFVDSSEVFSLKNDLFTRPDLIPDQAIADAEEWLALEAEEEAQEDAEAFKSETSRDASEEEEEKIPLEFQFDNPDGEDIFYPLSTDVVKLQSCLVYTVAFGKEEDVSIELIYELNFDEDNAAVRDENGEVEWTCIAYNAGRGWVGMEGETDENDS